MKNYGPHCREGQCGAGPFPSVHESNSEDQKSGWTDCDPANTDSQEAARIAEEQRLERESTVSSVQDNLLKSHSESGMCSGSTDYKYYGNRTGVAQQNSTGEGRGYYETSVGTCAQKDHAIFVVE